MPRKNNRKIKPDAATYIRLILGMPMHLRILPTNQQNRLDLSVALVEFITKNHPKQKQMAEFLRNFIQDCCSRSWAYGVLEQLKTIGIVKWDDYYNEYHPNMNRWERDWERVRSFKAQINKWNLPGDVMGS